VIHTVLAEECRFINRRFFPFHLRKRPYILLKWAQTSDGFIDIVRDAGGSEPAWISNDISRMIVHKWRAEEQSILVGTNTALMDNPRLNVREWPGRSPVRMVLDRNLRLPAHLHLFDNTLNTLVFNEKIERHTTQTRLVRLDFDHEMLSGLLSELYDRNIQSVMVEGGRKLIDGFLADNLWDEARVFVGPICFGNGVPAPLITHVAPKRYSIRKDTLLVYLNPSETSPNNP
jgi:diaminohydroxyphosphoribosylaminopyrimidine deaminase/5-amino-6-(5-phosphoribosylamino)uracil reductase